VRSGAQTVFSHIGETQRQLTASHRGERSESHKVKLQQQSELCVILQVHQTIEVVVDSQDAVRQSTCLPYREHLLENQEN